MKKRNVIGAALLSMALVAGATMGTAADSRKVLTLGANLSEAQEEMMLNYFGVTYDEVDVITITNEDEREHLGAYVPLEQIGKYTFSCALVCPTTSGGIQVKTANLDWVTANMIATTLSTSGVVNCQVIAASPIQVSGTGALTGIIMAYEEASGEELDAVKKELATQELVITGQLANTVGQKEATAIVNEVKTEIISQEIKDITMIQQIIVDAATANQAAIAEEEISMVAELMEQIAQEDYDYEEMKDTLARVEENVSMMEEVEEDTEAVEETEETTEAAGMSAEEAAAAAQAAAQEAANAAQQAAEAESEVETETEAETEESILDKTNDSALGEGVISGSTQERETESEVETEAVTETPATEAATEAVTEAPATEAATEAVTETPATEAATEAVTEAPATEAATEAVTEAPATEAVTEVETEKVYTEEDLEEAQKDIYEALTWYLDKLFAVEAEEVSPEVAEDELYKKIEELEVTELFAADEEAEAAMTEEEKAAQKEAEETLREAINTYILTYLAEGLEEEMILSEEEIAEFANVDIKVLYDEIERILVEDEALLFEDMVDEEKEIICDEWKAFLRKLYAVDEWEEETEMVTEAPATEAAGTEAVPEETATEAAGTEAAPEEAGTEVAGTEAAPEEAAATEAAATEATGTEAATEAAGSEAPQAQ